MRLFRLLALLAPAQAGAFELSFPVSCTLGASCFIQQYPDRDPGPGAADFTCGPLAADTLGGTDIALPTNAAMLAGVEVRAAAAGTVLAVRDGMPDVNAAAPGAPDIAGRDCGNGVVVDHGDGWQTQYCHLRLGSIGVAEGAEVEAGAALGLIGLSGRTTFPHLHFVVRKDGVSVDPFDPDSVRTCDDPPADPLWATPVTYQPGGFTGIGIATSVPGFDAIRDGLPTPDPFPPKGAAMILWAQAFGGQPGDEVELVITGPDGEVARQTVILDQLQAQFFRAAGVRLQAAEWTPGRYAGIAILRRNGAEIGRIGAETTVER